MFTVPVVLRVVVCDADAPVSEIKSDLIKPSELLCLTFDHPSDRFSITSTLVFSDSDLIIDESVDGPVLMLTVPVVFKVAMTSLVDAAAAVVDKLPLPRVRKSDLIKPDLPSTLTFDQPAGSCSVTSTLVPFMTVPTTLESVDAADLMLTPSVVRNVAAVFPIGNLRKSDLIYPVEFPVCTFDQPAGSCSRTSTFVPASTTKIVEASVEGSDLRLTLSVVRNVPAAIADGAIPTIPAIKQVIMTRNIIFCNLWFTTGSP